MKRTSVQHILCLALRFNYTFYLLCKKKKNLLKKKKKLGNIFKCTAASSWETAETATSCVHCLFVLNQLAGEKGSDMIFKLGW